MCVCVVVARVGATCDENNGATRRQMVRERLYTTDFIILFPPRHCIVYGFPDL